jgi:hypothetical protein
MYDVVFEGSLLFEATIPYLTSIILKYALYLKKDTPSVVLGIFAPETSGHQQPALSFTRTDSDVEFQQITSKLFELLRSRVRVYLKVLLPVDLSFIEV